MLLCFVKFWAGIRNFSSCIGTTTVTVTVYNADEEQIFKQDLKVKVKKNATDVAVTGIADGDKVNVGQTIDVTLPRQGVDTDERDLTVDKADNVEIKAGEKARTYTVKFLKAGEVTFTAKAFQSTKYPATTAKKEIKVSVANPAPTAVKAVAAEAFELTFEANVEEIYKDAKSIATDAIYYVINDTKIPFSAVKEVKATGNTVKVTMYDTFAAGTEYFVALADADALSFQIAGNAGKDVVGIKILTSTAVVDNGKAQDIKYALYNADGVDITTTAKADLNVNISLEAAAGTTNAYVSGETITMYTVGDVAEVSATFKYYDPNNNYTATTYTDTVKITAVAPSPYAYAGFVYTIDNGANGITMTYSNPKKYFALDQGAVFQAILKYTKDNASYTYIAGKDNLYNGKALVAKVAD